MFNLKKITSVFLIFALALIMLSACAQTDKAVTDDDGGVAENASDGSETEANNEEVEEDKWVQEPHNLPEKDFDGRDFNVITVEMASPNRMYDLFSVEEQTGEPIADALYQRRLTIEEKYNVKMNTTQTGDPGGTAKKSILAGDNSYDLIVTTIGSMKDLGSQKLLADLYTVPYISENLDKPWWDHALKRDLSINGKLYFQAGNIVLRDKLRLSCLYFNKDMCKTLGVEYPYKYVYEGTWTVDKLMEITKGVNIDLNGDGVMDQADQWGFMSQHEFSLHLFEASGEKMVSLNKDGIPEVTINTPRALDVIQKALAACAEPGAMFHADRIKGASDIWLTASEYFQENRFLMRASVFEAVPRDLRAMPTDFGVLPTPKYDENQENYYTYVESSGLIIGIPMNADTEFSGFITEALAYESGTTLMPAFYDLCLTSKVLRDDESEGMLDIIFNNKVYDIGYIYGIGTLPGMFSGLAAKDSTDFISTFEKAEGSIEKALQKFMDNYDKE